MKLKNYNLGFFTLAFAFIAFAFIAFPSKVAFAYNDVNLAGAGTIAVSGDHSTVDFTSIIKGQRICPGGTGGSINVRVYSGSYPSVITLIDTYATGTCSNTNWTWGTNVGTFPFALEGTSGTNFADGNYWARWFVSTNGNTYYYNFTIVGGYVVQNDSYILYIDSPVLGAVNQTPLFLSGAFSDVLGEYDTVRMELYNTTTGFAEIKDVYVGQQYSNNYPFATYYAPNPGEYTIDAYLYSSITDTEDTFVLAGVFTIDGYTSILDPATECSLTELASCLQIFVTWAFVPSQETLNQFASLTLENSAPFSYLYDIQNVWDELLNTAQTQTLDLEVTTGIGNITFISEDMLNDIPMSATVRTILGYLLWLMTAFTIFRIIKSQVF